MNIRDDLRFKLAQVSGLILIVGLIVYLFWGCTPQPEKVPPYIGPTYPRLCAYAGIQPTGFPLTDNGNGIADYGDYGAPVDTLALRFFGKFAVVIPDAHPVCDVRRDILDALVKLNPTALHLAYVMPLSSWPWNGPRDSLSRSTWVAQHRLTVEHYDALLAFLPGQGDLVNVNLAKQDSAWGYPFADSLVNLLVRLIPQKGLDGMFFDAFGDWVSPAQFDLRKAGYKNIEHYTAAYLEARIQVAKQLRSRLPKNFLLVLNGGLDLDGIFNGVLRERFPGLWGGTWETNMLGKSGALGDSTRYFQPPLSILFANITDPVKQAREVRLAIASACLAGQAVVIAPANVNWQSRWWTWCPDEFSVDQAGRADSSGRSPGWLGAPRGPAFQVGNVWRRDFEHGAVLVNPGPLPERGSIGTGYRRIAGRGINDGAMVETVTIGARDGLLLVKD